MAALTSASSSIYTDHVIEIHVINTYAYMNYRIAGKFGGAKFWRIANFW